MRLAYADAAFIADRSPDRVIAECRADLALLDVMEGAPRLALGVHGVNLTGTAWATLNARYPEGES
jgi:hypothetical protein